MPGQELGRSRGGLSTKVHVRCDGVGLPLAFHLTSGERPDREGLRPLLDAVAIRRAGRGRPRKRPQRLIADRAYSSAAGRTELRRRGIGAVIPKPANQRRRVVMNWHVYRERNHVERLIARLKQFRRVATRYEKLASNYQAMLTIAAIRLLLRL